MEFCKCGSIKKAGKCTNLHCTETNQKRKDWIAGGVNMAFKKPVTYEEAIQLAERIKHVEKNI